MFKKDIVLPQIPSSATAEDRLFYEGLLNVIRDLRRDVAQLDEWVNVTYINSWIDFNTANFTVSYLKDNFGFVHLRGICKNGSTANPFVMPENYRPAKAQIFPLYSVPSETTVTPAVTIAANGTVTLSNYTNTVVSFDGVIFQAA